MVVRNATAHSAMAHVFYEEINRSRLRARAFLGRTPQRTVNPHQAKWSTDQLAHELAIECAERLQKILDIAKADVTIGRRRSERPKTMATSPRQRAGL